MKNRDQRIAERLRQMPPKYKPMYRRAVMGKGLRDRVNCQCLECCGWQSAEVTLCTDLGCCLYAVRPYQNGAGTGQDGQFTSATGPNGAEGE